jgi:cation diffusion facilitator CzcD-associated flavoprotein CzcO
MTQHYDAVCVGGGFAGIYHLFVSAQIVERLTVHVVERLNIR